MGGEKGAGTRRGWGGGGGGRSNSGLVVCTWLEGQDSNSKMNSKTLILTKGVLLSVSPFFPQQIYSV